MERWGEGYFAVNDKGHLVVRPMRDPKVSVDVYEVVEKLKGEGVQLPILFRFPQVLDDRIRTIHEAFKAAVAEYQYKGRFRGVFPMKVNQRREVIEELIRFGKKWDYGLEVGTKPELLGAIAMDPNPDSLLILNGFKDREMIRLAVSAAHLKRNVIIVVDKIDEAQMIVDEAKDSPYKPKVGLRLKLHAKGGGKWGETSGDKAKFGLTVPEIVQALEVFKAGGMQDRVRMLHFHIGSQISDIKKWQNAVREAARVYAKLRKMGLRIEYMDCGGGLGVDYDGSQTLSPTSKNYDDREYANTIVYNLKTICDEEGVDHPTIVLESGRPIVAYQTFLVVDIIRKTPGEMTLQAAEPLPNDPPVVRELYGELRECNLKNYLEAYHDAEQQREDLLELFNLGYMDLTTRARGEVVYWKVLEKVLKFAVEDENDSEEVEDLKKKLAKKYIANFSLFQSTPDIWGVKQLFPIMPIHRLNEEPKEFGNLVDITCDSDGEIRKFIAVQDVKEFLELHALNGGAYYVGIFLLGAYQDTLGDFHNLLGTANEVHVVGDEKGWKVDRLVQGDSVAAVLGYLKYDPNELMNRLRAMVAKAVEKKDMPEEVAKGLTSRFERTLEAYTYLKPE